MKFTYHVNLDERGYFFADVRDENENSIYDIHSNEDGEIPEVTDGFMHHSRDLEGLSRHLQSMGIIPKESTISRAA